MLLILFVEFIVGLVLWFIYTNRQALFNNLFSLLFTGVILAFIPNFTTSILLFSNTINNMESQVGFGITGTIASIFLYKVLSMYDVK